MQPLQAFYAYASQPERVSESISNAIEQINSSTSEIEIIGWERMTRITARPIIDRVCNYIDESDLFICDLTTHNHNVLFELGYAIAKNKRIWITLNPDFHDAEERYRDLKLITTLGYQTYTDSYELRNKFFADEPFKDTAETIFERNQEIIQNTKPKYKNSVFHLKSQKETKEATELERALRRGKLTIIQDDPQQGTGQSLGWYLENIFNAVAVLIHLSTPEKENQGHDAKYSLAAGIAYGFELPLLILAHAPFKTPIDYRDITVEHETAQSCVDAYTRWIDKVIEDIEDLEKTREIKIGAVDDLRSIDIGHYLAENETDLLDNYFVVTTAYEDAINSNDYLLFVGRKGTGKTANFYILAEDIGDKAENHVCLIRPVKYEFEGIFRLFGLSTARAETGYLLQSIWKFLIYTELAYSVYKELDERPSHIVHREYEQLLIDYVNQNEKLIGADFSERLQYAIREICKLDIFNGTQEEKTAVSEILHERVIGKLREYLGTILAEREKVTILVDNLDEGWERREDLSELANFLFGLISIARQIASDFSRSRAKKPSINLSIQGNRIKYVV
ncbi:MAG: hypothetical protein AAFY41_09110 [Bacteroidota bacterium]